MPLRILFDRRFSDGHRGWDFYGRSVRCFYCLIVFLLLALLAQSCSKAIAPETRDVDKAWTCDAKADAALKRGDYELSMVLHEQLLRKDPENALAMYHLGYCHGQLENHEGEVTFYEKAVSSGLRDSNLFFNLGMAYGEMNDLAKANSAFLEAIEIDPENLEARMQLAILFVDIGDAANAADQLESILEIDPNNKMAKDLLNKIKQQ